MNTPRLLPLALALALSPALVAAQPATFERLGDLPGDPFNSTAYGVSTDGLVVVGQGRSTAASEAFRWEDGAMVPLGPLPGGVLSTSARAASLDGSVLVGERRTASGFQAVRWADGAMELLGIPPGTAHSIAYDVTPDGAVVVGTGGDGGANPPSAAFRWEAGVMQTLPDLPDGAVHARAHAVSADGRVVVGWGTGSAGNRAAVRWTDGVPEALDLPAGYVSSAAYDVSADGRVIVGAAIRVAEPFEIAFLWTDEGGMQEIPDLPGGYPLAEAFSISGDGRVVVGRSDSGTTLIEAFVWTAETSTRSLKGLLELEHGLDLTGWSLLATLGQTISHDGRTLVGFGHSPEGLFEAWRVVLPPLVVASEPEAPASVPTLSVAPNPARGTAGVRLVLAEAGRMRVAAFDVLGRAAAVLHDGTLGAGAHTYSLDTSRLAPGVYVVRAEGDGVRVANVFTVVH